MFSFKVLGARGLSGLNLVAPISGLTCRLAIEGKDADLPEDFRPQLIHYLSHITGTDKPGPSALNSRLQGDMAPFIAFFFGQFLIAVQRAAGCDVRHARMNAAGDPIVWDLFIEHEFESLNRRAGALTIHVIEQAAKPVPERQPRDELIRHMDDVVAAIRKEVQTAKSEPATLRFTKIAEDRKIPWRRISPDLQYVQIGYGKNQQIFQRSIIGNESHTSAELANSKEMTSLILGNAGLPVAKQVKVTSEEAAIRAAERIGYPVVIKPLAGMQGYGITPNIRNRDQLKRAFARVRPYHRQYIVEKHMAGDDYRILVIDGKYAGCVCRSISEIIGDGKQSIDQLVTELNKTPWRNQFAGEQKYHVRKLDVITECLKDQGFDWDSIPGPGDIVKLHIVPNLSQGGTNTEIGDEIHPEIIKMAERAAAVLNLKIAGVDYLTTDISKPFWQSGGGICEVNVSPAIDVMYPTSPDKLQHLFEWAFDLCFPADKDFSIPVFAVLGDGSDLARNLSEALSRRGLKVGYRGQDKSTIDGSPLSLAAKGGAATAVLWNGLVEAVVIEETVLDIQKYGLGYNLCSCLVVQSMPQFNDRNAPEVLDLIAKTVTEAIFINGSDPLLCNWADEHPDLPIHKISGKDGQADDAALLDAAMEQLPTT